MTVASISDRFSMMDSVLSIGAIPIPESGTAAFTQQDWLHLMGLYGGLPAAELDVTSFKIQSTNFTRGATVTDTTTAVGLTLIGPADFELRGLAERTWFCLKIRGGPAVDLSEFVAEGQLIDGGEWVTLQSTWGATGDEDSFVLHSTGDLENLGHDTSGVAALSTYGLWGLRFKRAFATAPSEAVTTTLVVYSQRMAGTR